ncbi:GntR family transcriptional regulator [Enterovirga sp. CN4-39]|uniref:GntR family transcriptional regulator n=1 Tax=Enterovirga sp. CN4-39 TaxID=3400910 RepID=UPI003C11EFE1
MNARSEALDWAGAQLRARTPRKGERHGNAVAALREMIVSGQLAPGTRLKEVELCAVLGVSRTPLREAVKVLASEGLVGLLPNRSAVVAELDLAGCEALYEVVIVLEELAARLACPRISDQEVGRVGALHEAMVAHHARSDLAAYFEINQQIHEAVVQASDNPVLIDTWTRLNHQVRRAKYLPNVLGRTRWPEAVREHEEMLAALRARDGERLASLIRPHFANGLAVLKAASRHAEGTR